MLGHATGPGRRSSSATNATATDQRPVNLPLTANSTVPLLMAAAVLTMSQGTVFALLAEIQDRYGIPTWGLGFIGGTSFATLLVAQVSLSRLADRGHATTLLRGGLVATGIGLVVFGLSSDLWQFVLGRGLIGLGAGMFLPAVRRVLLVESTKGAGEVLGRLASIEVAGFVVGPPLAAALSIVAGLRVPFIVQGAAVMLWAPRIGRIGTLPVEDGLSAPHRPILQLMGIPAIRAALLVAVASHASIGAFEATWARFMADHGASTGMTAMTLMVFPLPLVVLAQSAGRTADRVGALRAARWALLASCPIFVLYGVVDLFWALFAVAVLQSIIDALLMPAGQAAAASAAPPGLIAVGQGLYGSVGAASAGLASVACAAIYDGFGSSWMWLGLALTVLICGCLADSARDAPVGPT